MVCAMRVRGATDRAADRDKPKQTAPGGRGVINVLLSLLVLRLLFCKQFRIDQKTPLTLPPQHLLRSKGSCWWGGRAQQKRETIKRNVSFVQKHLQ